MSSVEDSQEYRWAPGTLLRTGCEDARACVLQMLANREPREAILAMLDDLQLHTMLEEVAFETLRTYVLARTNALVDANPVFPIPNQAQVLAPEVLQNVRRCPEQLQANTAKAEAETNRVWSAKHSANMPWHVAGLSRPPSQACAFA